MGISRLSSSAGGYTDKAPYSQQKRWLLLGILSVSVLMIIACILFYPRVEIWLSLEDHETGLTTEYRLNSRGTVLILRNGPQGLSTDTVRVTKKAASEIMEVCAALIQDLDPDVRQESPQGPGLTYRLTVGPVDRIVQLDALTAEHAILAAERAFLAALSPAD